jgi:uncharacterized protein (TIGR02271 family)
MTRPTGPHNDDVVIPLFADSVSVDRRKVEGNTIRLTVQTNTREHLIDEKLEHMCVEIERIPIGRTIEAAPPVRTEGDTVIIPVIEERVVVERRLVLKEEIILRRVRTTERHQESVVLREQEVLVERTAPDEKSQHIEAISNQPITSSKKGDIQND